MSRTRATARKFRLTPRLVTACLILDAAELLVCGLPLWWWMDRVSWSMTWLRVAAPLTMVLWSLSALRLAGQLRPILAFARAFERGEKPKLPEPTPTKRTLDRVPRESALAHLGGWILVTLSLVVGGQVRGADGDTFLASALVQLVLFSAVSLAAARALALEVILAAVRPALLPNLQGVRRFAERFEGGVLAVGLAFLGLSHAVLALFILGFGDCPLRALAMGAFLWWPLMFVVAALWWRAFRAQTAPIADYLELVMAAKGNKGIPREEPKAVAAFIAAQGVAYRLCWIHGPGLLAAGWLSLVVVCRVGAGGAAFFLRGAVVVFIVSLLAALYQALLTQHLLRPFMRHLGSRHYLPLARVRAPLSLGPKLIITLLSAMGVGCLAVWLQLSTVAPALPVGRWPLLLSVFLVLGIMLLVVRDTVAPLHALEERSEEMATGQLARPVPPWGEANEIGRLALVFEEMRRSLRDRLRSTESINVDLEREVRRRTEALEQRNTELHEALDKLRRAQDNLVRSEKLASMGRLVAGIAHEINNPVNAVINSLGPLEEVIAQLKDGSCDPKAAEVASEALEILAVVQRGSSRTKAIVQALHGYARGDDKIQREVYIARSVEETLGLLVHRLRHVKVEREIPPDVRILGFPGQLDQVLMNLLINAAQAIGDQGGTIRITAENQDTAVLVTVEDDGPGIPPEILNHIFDPFFTTKDVGEGSGLGLSIVHGIIDRHGGKIDVHSELGKGTRFALSFPLPPVKPRQ